MPLQLARLICASIERTPTHEDRGMAPPKVIIVGAGPGGLASALQLAKAGADVTILEKQTWVGGRTATFEQNGFHFDIMATRSS